MLLDDAQVALNEVIVVLKEAAARYRDAAEVAQDAGLTTLFQAIGRQHQRMGEELEAHIRQTGALPREPDIDRETMGSLMTRLKAMLSEDELLTLLEEREHAEKEIASCIGNALAEDLPDATVSILKELYADVDSTRQHLAAVKARISKD